MRIPTNLAAQQSEEAARKFRFERKYYVSPKDAEILRQRVAWLMRPDAHSDGAYRISSLYFDDIHNSSFHQKQNGILVRNKLRLRYYNDDLGFIRLEHKHKNGDMISKTSVPVTLDQYNCIKNGEYNFILAENNPLWTMFYARHKTLRLCPVVLVEYSRQVFTYAPGNVRITFDADMQASLPYADARLSALPSGYLILEVKYDNFLPEVIAKILSCTKLTQIAVSKYTMCREVLFNGSFYAP